MSGVVITGKALEWHRLKALCAALKTQIAYPEIRLGHEKPSLAAKTTLGYSRAARIPNEQLLIELEQHITKFESNHKDAIAAGIETF